MKRILFVCTGNTCRSPMAEAMLRRMAALRGITVAVRSAGISTIDGLPVSAHAVETLRQRDIDHKSTSLALTGEAVGWADIILTMTSNHKRGLLQWYPEAVDKTYTLKEYANRDAQVLADIEELERLYSEMQMKQALGQQLTSQERNRLLELERKIPSFDIVDPFGGSLSIYNSSASEIEDALVKLLDKLSKR
ncbi:protein-tyrosine phosphatase [Paenibacillus endophyticus]|uniref:Protein-tyrosine phosphatase n=1 Tax=Paenibacillus endophyticus TaxID=1294268 RepID=A0A7W5CBA7_9BACL|nr:low molecular weight protein arginine phosphatase [Paenibacillus endophyticus]MBB3154551.1 protein-tyrosine phosphatase [Paenibacillus endophyticus]